MEKIVWQALIDGKKAQGDLTYAKEELECTKHNYSVVSEQKEIAYQNYLKITDDLQKQLQKAQDALNVARNLYEELALSYCQMADDYRTTYGCLKTPEQETQEYMQEYDKEIASITAGGKE